MIKLSNGQTQEFYVVDEKDIAGLNKQSYEHPIGTKNEYYYVIVKWSQQWINVDAETFYKVKTLLEAKIK